MVGVDGHTRDLQIKKGLGMGLDEKAVEAVKQWKFKPAEKDGKPVEAKATAEVTFRLK